MYGVSRVREGKCFGKGGLGEGAELRWRDMLVEGRMYGGGEAG